MVQSSAFKLDGNTKGLRMSLIRKHQDAGRSIFMSSIRGLANTLAIVVTFFGAPPLYSKSVGWIQAFAVSHYGYGVEDATAIVWGLVCAALVFFISRASISTALVMGGLAVATRFL
ncbi:hypothetical protein ACP2AV_07355 [Aliiroseovarius sp. PTFE2010]|uniref:hypothetical protein n=1 Tax=Aliiroseovarius sp. PTFE2010 TaxID=3417190 RepID=UPI003CEAA2BA